MPDQDGYSIREIADRLRKASPQTELGLITRYVRYWVAESLLRPRGSIQRGRGRDRVFDLSQIVRAGIIFELSRYNVTANSMRFMMKELDLEVKIRNVENLFDLIDALPVEYCFRFAALGD